jgi:glyoxylase-like metal-dependent hydrolase (beta-lactamase superfamily II)
MVTRLRDSVWWIDLRGVNAYLVDDDGDLTLVDAGMPWQAGDVVDAVVEAGFVLDDLDRVLVTHYDPDHVGGLSRLDGLDITIYVGQTDAPLVTGRERPSRSTPKALLQRLFDRFYTPPKNEVVHSQTATGSVRSPSTKRRGTRRATLRTTVGLSGSRYSATSSESRTVDSSRRRGI